MPSFEAFVMICFWNYLLILFRLRNMLIGFWISCSSKWNKAMYKLMCVLVKRLSYGYFFRRILLGVLCRFLLLITGRNYELGIRESGFGNYWFVLKWSYLNDVGTAATLFVLGVFSMSVFRESAAYFEDCRLGFRWLMFNVPGEILRSSMTAVLAIFVPTLFLLIVWYFNIDKVLFFRILEGLLLLRLLLS
jgi:hypothetical protein